MARSVRGRCKKRIGSSPRGGRLGPGAIETPGDYYKKDQVKSVCYVEVVSICESSKLPIIQGKIEGRDVDMLVDTGAMVTLVHERLVRNTPVNMRATNKTVSGVTGATMEVLGEADVEFQIGREKCSNRQTQF